MCCPTGVCGPSVDPKLTAFAADLDWLEDQGAEVERYNLAQQPQAFAESTTVAAELQKDAECLPLVLVDGEIVARGCYPDGPHWPPISTRFWKPNLGPSRVR